MLTVRVHDWKPWSEMNRMMSSGRARRDERADRIVGLPEDVGDLLPDARVLVLRVVGVVGRDVVGEAVLRAVDAHPDARHQVPLGVVHQPLGGLDALARDLERLVQVGVGLVVIRGPAHAVDRPLEARPSRGSRAGRRAG